MPNLVAYNSGSTISNALQFGTIVMDVNNTVNLGSLLWCPDYGICNQYLIVTDSYTNGKTNQLTARAMGFQTSGLTDSDLIDGINKLASSKFAGPFGTLSDAINWAIYEGYFITNQEYPSIVTSGCVLNLDSNFPPSYPLVFNTWYDLTGNGNTGLLNNGITYNSALRGSLVLNGANQYVSFSATTGIPVGNSNYTIGVWFNADTLGDKGLVGWGNYGTTNEVNAFRLTSNGLTNYWWANDLAVVTTITPGNWYYAVATFDGTTRSIYVNGSLIGSDTPTGHNVTTSSNLTIGLTNTTEYFDGNMGEVQIFDRALSSTEITQNYNALLPRYNGTYTDPCDIAPSCLYNCANCIGTGWIPYNATSCYQVVTSAATAPVSSIPLIRRGAVEYSQFGTQFYDEGFSIGGTGTILQTSLTAPLWYNSPNNTVNGPMNRCAIWYSAYTITNTWLGFSTCLSGISTTNTYYVGIAADNEFKLVLDGVTILNTTLGSMGAVNKFKYWHVYPVTIPSGNHTLELYGLDYGVIAGFGMEIYDNTLSELTGATTLNDLNVIFSSSGYTTADIVQTIGGEYLSSGYTCPSGFVYSTCSGNCIDYEYCYSTSPTPTTTTTPTPTPTINICELSIGTSFQGGVVAYILQPGDSGYVPGYTGGLIATTGDVSTNAIWGCEGLSIPGATGTTIGTGDANTIAIMTDCATAGIAARLCGDLTEGGYSDWYLPSKDELAQLYINRALIGGFIGGANLTWLTSSENNANTVFGLDYPTGVIFNGYSKSYSANVRGVRSFSVPSNYCFTPTPTPTPSVTPVISGTCACYSFTNTTETTGEVYYTSCLGNSPTTSSVNAGLTITFCAVYGQPVTATSGTIGGLCAGFVQTCNDDGECSSCGSNTPTPTQTSTPTPTLVPSLGCSGGTISGTYSGNNQYTYPSQPVSSSVDSYINFSWGSLDRPNRFTVYDSTGLLWTSGWVGFADYAGPWGASLNTPSTGNSNICFLSSSGRYVLVEAGNASPTTPISDAYDYVMTCLGSCPGGATPTPTPTLTPTCDCVQFVNVEVTSSGVITYLDCNGVGQSQNVGIGPEVIGVATCINKNTLGGSASFTIDSIGPCCNVVTPTPTTTPTPSPTPAGIQATIEFSFYDSGSGVVSASMEVTGGVTLDSLSWGGIGIGYSSLGCSGTENTQSFSDVLGIGDTQVTTEVWGSISAILSAQNQTSSFTVNGNTINTVSQIITVGGHNYVITGVTDCFSPL